MGAFAALLANRHAIAAVGIGAALIIAVGAIYLIGRGDGKDAVRREIHEQNERAGDLADQAEASVYACDDAGRDWDVTTGTCL